MAKKAAKQQVKCPVGGCVNMLELLTEGNRLRAICQCGHKIYQNQSVVERPKQEEQHVSTE